MYQTYFEAVAGFLESKGIRCNIHYGRKLSDEELTDLPDTLKMLVPQDLLLYLQELGDGFTIEWELPGEGNLVSFGLSSLDDIKDECSWIHRQIRTAGDFTDEAKRRLHWLPIMGIGEGGYEFCLDTSTAPAPVRYYESEWRQNPSVWNSSLAPSLKDLACNWSRYCFSDPLSNGEPIDMTIVARKLDREFDWAPYYFDQRFDRETGSVWNGTDLTF